MNVFIQTLSQELRILEEAALGEDVKMGDDPKAPAHPVSVQRLMERQSTGSPSSATSAFASAAVCAFNGRFKTSRTVHQPEVWARICAPQ